MISIAVRNALVAREVWLAQRAAEERKTAMKEKRERSPWFWLGQAILAERIAMRETGLPRERVRACLVLQRPEDVLEAISGSLIALVAGELDGERERGAVVDLERRRSLRRAGHQTQFEEIARRAATIAKAHGRAPTDEDMLAARKDLE